MEGLCECTTKWMKFSWKGYEPCSSQNMSLYELQMMNAKGSVVAKGSVGLSGWKLKAAWSNGTALISVILFTCLQPQIVKEQAWAL